MNRGTKITLIFGIIAAMALMVWLFSNGKKPTVSGKKYVSADWSKAYGLFDKRPKGLFLFSSLIQAHTNRNVFVANNSKVFDSLVYHAPKPPSLVFVGENFGLLNDELESVLDQVYKGSKLLLAYNNLTDNIQDELLYNGERTFKYSEKATIAANGKSLEMIHLYQMDTIPCKWDVFENEVDEQSYSILSTIDTLANFIEGDFESGKILLNLSPQVFTNYQLKRAQGFEYASYVLEQLPKDRDVIFIEFGRLSDKYGSEEIEEEGIDKGNSDSSYLKLIFENEPLFIAMLLTLFALLLFVIFRSKRMRPIVPFIPVKKNMTISFAETITSIYFSKRNPYGLLQVLRKNFFSAINRHFYLDFEHVEREKGIEILAEKSNVSKNDIIEILNSLETKKVTSVSDQYVINVHKRLHAFYLSTGIISQKVQDALLKKQQVFNRPLVLPSVLILVGIGIIIVGLYFLMSSIGTGVILLPVGIALISLGIIQLSSPLLKVDQDKLYAYSMFGVKQEYLKEDLLNVETTQTEAQLLFRNNRKLWINYSDASRFDRARLQQLLSNL